MRMVKLGEIAKVFNGYAFKSSDYTTEGYQVIRIANVQKGYISNDHKKFINISDTGLERFILKRGDILISLTGNVGRVGAIEDKNLPAVLNQRVGKLIISSDSVNADYLFQVLNSNTIETALKEKAKGIAQKNICSADIENLNIPLPSIAEQKRIANILDEADALRQKRKQSIELLDEYLVSVYRGLADRAEDFVKLETLLCDKKGSIRTGPFGSDLKHSEFVESGISVIGIDNAVQNRFVWAKRRYITPEKYQKLDRYTVYPRDVIITIMGTTGRSAVIPDDIPLAINTKHLVSMTFGKTKANPYFICFSLQADPKIKQQIAHQSKGAIMDGLNMGIIKNLLLPKLDISVQDEFENKYHKAQRLKSKMFEQLEEIDNYYKMYLQKTFSTVS